MYSYTEKELFLSEELNEGKNQACNTYSSLKSILSKPFQCLPLSVNNFGKLHFDKSLRYPEDDSPLPDLPYVTNPVALAKCDISSNDKLFRLRKLMKKYNIGVYIIPSEDEHQSEYTALADRRREYISEFTGSAGIAVVTLDDADSMTGEAVLSTDGRYFLQAEKELDSNNWKLLKQGISSYPTWNRFAIDKAIGSNFSNVISCDPRLISVDVGEYFEKAGKLQFKNEFSFEPLIEVNLVDEIWADERPSRSMEPVYHLPIKYSGEHTKFKVKRVREVMKSKNNSTHLVVTALDDIAWLLNLRSDNDIPFSPVFFSYMIITLESMYLYIEKQKIVTAADDLRQYLDSLDGLTIKGYSEFYSDLSILKATIDNSDLSIILPSKSITNYALLSSIPQSITKESCIHDSIISNLKITKNKTELFNARIAQFKDSLAFILFSSWLEDQLINKYRQITEYEAACKMYSIRSKLPNFKGLSYETISSSGPNAAIIHYAPTKDENSLIDPTNVYLLDSGAHYLEGTTDITRTYKFGDVGLTDELKKYYTLVLKGHMAVATAKFPPNSSSTGTILDCYARQPLWNEGLDYNHGTGHGVGSFGNVHEGPLYISTTNGGPTFIDLFKKGGILTDEPGYYVDGKYGFRIESELEIIEIKDAGKTRDDDDFLGFAYLTKVPFCKKLIDSKYLTSLEIKWINDYHTSVREEFSGELLEIGDQRAYDWLINETSPL